MKEPFFIGISGGSASGKTTVAANIIKQLDVQWVTLLSMDSFYKVLNQEEHEAAAQNQVHILLSLENVQKSLIQLCHIACPIFQTKMARSER